MDSSPYALPVLQNSLLTHIVTNSILDQLTSYLSKIPDIQNLKMDLEILLHAMKHIEVFVANDPSQTKVDKKALLLEAFKIVFPNCLTDAELAIITNGVDFMFNSDLVLIQKVEKTIAQYLCTPFRSIYKKLFRKN